MKISIVTLVVLACAISVQAGCRESFTAFQNACYKKIDTPMAFVEAQARCSQEGGNLASIPNIETNEFLRTSLGLESGPYLIGLWRQNQQVKQYRWRNGNAASFRNWGPGEPRNALGTERCTVISAGSGEWNDLPCHLKRRFICSHGPGEVDSGDDKDEVIESLQENLEELQDKVAELMEEIEKCTEQNRNLNSQIALLDEENGVLKEQNSNLEAENARLKEEKENIQAKVDELESEVESLKNEVDALNDEISNLESENTQLKEEIENLQNKVNKLESEVESLKNEIDGLKEENEELKKENSNLKDEVALLEAKLEECESEKSQEPDPGWYAPGNGYQYKALRKKQVKESCVSACVKIDAELAIVGMEELDMRRDIFKATKLKKSTWIGSKDKDVCEMVKGGKTGKYAIKEEKCSEKFFCLCEKSL